MTMIAVTVSSGIEKVTAVDRGGDGPLQSGFCTSNKPFYFSVAVPEGNYRRPSRRSDRIGALDNDRQGRNCDDRCPAPSARPSRARLVVTRTFTVNVGRPRDLFSADKVSAEVPARMTAEMWNS